MLEFIREADALIIDAQYDRQEYSEHIGWGHGCVDDVVRLAAAARVRQMFLFHHDPGHDDARITQILGDARALAESLGSPVRIEAAREGAEFEISAD
jgi:ribonuclease BN (tRNA processing enzyme)